ncbi:MAG TPA: glycosyltransferase [Kineosporiaceae bacterium]|nr:glycosyltransferase [Kineosporiaceae bacterium]
MDGRRNDTSAVRLESPTAAAPTGAGEPTSVFLDPSGRRWRTLLALGLISITALVTVTTWAAPRLLDPPEPGHHRTAVELPLGAPVPPTVGEGPLERVLHVEQSLQRGARGLDPFTGRPVTVFSEEEAADIGTSEWVLQRYGYPGGSTHLISLTFDDGPDPVFTPQLLDVLSREKVPATFFVTGQRAVAAPDIIRREIREGHAIGNHSLTHPDFNSTGPLMTQAQLVLTDRLLRDVTGQRSAYTRMPFGGFGDGSTIASINAILRLQQFGYVSASYDSDTLDWSYDSGESAGSIPLPQLDGRNLTVLLHDAGGDSRQKTVDYVQNVLIPAAKARGYTFVTMPQAQAELQAATGPVTVTGWDTATRQLATVALTWPQNLLSSLFAFAVMAVIGVGGLTVTLALARRLRRRRFPEDAPVLPVTVLIAAYNEEKVIARTLRALRHQTYPLLEIVVVDDGSTDATSDEVLLATAEDPRIRLLRQRNQGKWAALNHGLSAARGEIVVTLDADTIFAPQTVHRLVRQFTLDGAERLGAVAGVVRVANRNHNLLTRWQALEYLTQIGVERAAYARLGAIPVVPGACAAWRRRAVLEAGGYSGATLAEDCDLTLALQTAHWRISQDDEAIALTEAPQDVKSLLAQRVRWTFGTLQSLSKHRELLLRRKRGWLGLVVLPYTLLAALTPVLFTPFVVVMAVQTVRDQGWWVLGVYFALFTAVHLVVAAVAVALMREPVDHLLLVPLYRLVYEPLRIYLMYTSVYLALRGVRLGWNKLRRTGRVDAALDPSAPVPAPGAEIPVREPVSGTVGAGTGRIIDLDRLTVGERDPATGAVVHGGGGTQPDPRVGSITGGSGGPS